MTDGRGKDRSKEISRRNMAKLNQTSTHAEGTKPRKAGGTRKPQKRRSGSVHDLTTSSPRKSPGRARSRSPVARRGSVSPGGVSRRRLTKRCKARQEKIAKRIDKVYRLINKTLKSSPEAAAVLNTETRKRTVYVHYTSQTFADVMNQHPGKKPDQVFKELAARWRNEIRDNPAEYNKYRKLAEQHNDRMSRTGRS
jgi:HMG (high mobility group) box